MINFKIAVTYTTSSRIFGKVITYQQIFNTVVDIYHDGNLRLLNKRHHINKMPVTLTINL